jgi:hypothetical protein
VLNVGGMDMGKALPEVDQINYLPRITQPVLMLNGIYDMYFPVESSQKPMFRLLGTSQAQKKMIVYPSGHLVPPTEFIKETLAWLHTYSGPTPLSSWYVLIDAVGRETKLGTAATLRGFARVRLCHLEERPARWSGERRREFNYLMLSTSMK